MSGSICGCITADCVEDCCHCCCENCCDSVTLEYECGCPWTPNFTEGCSCTPAALLAQTLQFPEMPDFEIGKKITSGAGDVFALDSACSIPCETVSVSVSSTCCLDCSGCGVTAIGAGVVSASVGGGSGGCGPYTVRVNGSLPPVAVNNGDGVGISLEPMNGLCSCCCIKCTNDCEATPLYKHKGGKLFLNKRSLKLKLEILATRKERIMAARIQKQITLRNTGGLRNINPKKRGR